MKIELAEENALILIEEIENGLHPIATVRMVEYLISVAERKKIQAIFTTHSNDALLPLPPEAIWSAVERKVFQGKLNIHALRAITGQIDAQLAIFVEDEFAGAWITAMLRTRAGVAVDLIAVHGMAGDGIAVEVTQFHNKNPSIPFPAVCYVDGDSKQKTIAEKFVYRLPGESPEAYVYDSVLDRIDECVGKLAVALHCKFEDQERIRRIVTEVRQTNRDPHLLYSQVGAKIGLLSEAIVKSAFVSIWAQEHPAVVEELLEPIDTLLPLNGSRN